MKPAVLEELADVEEVIEGVLKQLKTKRRELIGKQRVKKAKAGGFEEGFVLVDTSNPSAQTIRAKLRMFQYERTPIMAKWVDQREHSSATERLLNLVVSLTNEQWSAESPEILLGAGQPVIRATIDGTRTGASLKLAISIFMPPTQLKLIE